MRALEGSCRLRRVGARGCLAALGTFALLLQLALASVHIGASLAPLGAAGGPALVASAPEGLAARPAHSHLGGCALCRAAGQLRLALRLPASCGAFAALAPLLRLEAPAGALAPPAPPLVGAGPRAPPVA